MFIKKDYINKFFGIFLFVHLLIWTLIPALTNSNLPLDTIESLAWASDLTWGYNKHPPLSAWFSGLIFKVFSNQDWAYYLLSQLFVVFSFIVVWKFSENFFKNKIYILISLLLLESIFFYNFTTPEFNVYVCELPFWALTVLYYWKGIKQNDYAIWLLFGFFAGLGVLSHYLFIYLLLSLGFFTLYMIIKNKFNYKCLISIITFFIVLLPHIIWLKDNNFITVTYALHRTGLEEWSFQNHIYNPLIFLAKQIGLLIPFFIMLLFIVSKFKFRIKFKDKKMIFLFIINIVPILLILLTSLFLGARIKTMWMTPFYLFMGVFFIYIFQNEDDAGQLICTYNIEMVEDYYDGDEAISGTISLHRKKQSNTLYTINALNETIRKLNNGVLDKSFPIPWENYQNNLLLTNESGLNIIPTKIFKIINVKEW